MAHGAPRRLPQHRLPLWLKLAFTAWILGWAPTFAVLLGTQNYFWLCNLANFLILVGLWREHRLLLSMQWLAVALVGSLWAVDVGTAWLTGVHPIGGTEYMFDPGQPPLTRMMSLYHLILPPVAGFAIWRLGYDRRALLWQTALTWVVVPLTYVATDPERNINWVHGPFGQPQDSLDPLVYLAGLTLLWPVAVYLPVHLLMIGLQHWRVRHRH
ncbi:hypothetical protein [Halomonas heilongjiangensis]|uniref:Membrane-associated protein n=1 Tax=Halomonas heilongjiangensis TaxID=1387883 RepID=A0A2N7TJ41_9GAMM|nr:hypothetical protein [Halomonas heilongjiangensis]PMR68190.1 hypothetical protein C1H66_16365 [Halomonas heilongjiangensis]PXX87716.1 hypothetical protein CR158_18105 [Halomonas heilongjiangensis]